MDAPAPTDCCPACGGPLIRKSRGRLLLVGVAFVFAALAAPWLPRGLLVPAALLGLTGLYLLSWALWGKARRCRHCKTFPRN